MHLKQRINKEPPDSYMAPQTFIHLTVQIYKSQNRVKTQRGKSIIFLVRDSLFSFWHCLLFFLLVRDEIEQQTEKEKEKRKRRLFYYPNDQS